MKTFEVLKYRGEHVAIGEKVDLYISKLFNVVADTIKESKDSLDGIVVDTGSSNIFFDTVVYAKGVKEKLIKTLDGKGIENISVQSLLASFGSNPEGMIKEQIKDEVIYLSPDNLDTDYRVVILFSEKYQNLNSDKKSIE